MNQSLWIRFLKKLAAICQSRITFIPQIYVINPFKESDNLEIKKLYGFDLSELLENKNYIQDMLGNFVQVLTNQNRTELEDENIANKKIKGLMAREFENYFYKHLELLRKNSIYLDQLLPPYEMTKIK